MRQQHILAWALCGVFTPLITTPASADSLLGIYAGMGVWDVSIDGSLGTDDVPMTTDELGIDNDQSNYFYIALEHPIPLLPNIRLQHTTLKNEGYAVVTRDFTFDNVTFPANAATTTRLDLTQTDVTLYYEILDNWVSLDLGLTAKVLDGYGKVVAEPEGSSTVTEETKIEGAVPMLYGMAKFDLPLTGLYVGGQLNYISYDNSSISDLDIKVGWLYDSILDIGAELGYRKFAIELKDFDDANADLTYDGPYLNLAVHF